MRTQGTVRTWTEEGWGVIDSPTTPGGCWTHWSHVLVPGFRELHPGQVVELEWERAEQDGYAYRTVSAWPSGQDPVDDAVRVTGPSEAYSTTLTLTFDDPADDDPADDDPADDDPADDDPADEDAADSDAVEHQRWLDHLTAHEAAAMASPTWAEQVHTALLDYFAQHTGTGHFDANGARLHRAWTATEDGRPVLHAVYDHPWRTFTTGLRRYLDRPPMLPPPPEDTAVGLAEEIATGDVGEPLGTYAQSMVPDDHGTWWWGDDPLPGDHARRGPGPGICPPR